MNLKLKSKTDSIVEEIESELERILFGFSTKEIIDVECEVISSVPKSNTEESRSLIEISQPENRPA